MLKARTRVGPLCPEEREKTSWSGGLRCAILLFFSKEQTIQLKKGGEFWGPSRNFLKELLPTPPWSWQTGLWRECWTAAALILPSNIFRSEALPCSLPPWHLAQWLARK